MRREKCAVQGLLLGGCVQLAVPGGDLCTYHDKLAKGLTRPPGDDGYFLNPTTEPPALTAIGAYSSYRNSTHPQFADLVETGGYVTDGEYLAREGQDRVQAGV